MSERRLETLRAALGFLELPVRAPELRLLHRWLDNWMGVGMITVGVERFGYRLSLSHIADGEWRGAFSGHPLFALFAPLGFGWRRHRGGRATATVLKNIALGGTTGLLPITGPLGHFRRCLSS
jgi:hypothetical protein